MKLRYVVITSVNRDDLADGGSRHFAETVRQVRRALPEARVEVLTPDFCGDLDAVARVLDAGPHVFNHNMETVPRLYRAGAPAGRLPAVAGRAGVRAELRARRADEVRLHGGAGRNRRGSACLAARPAHRRAPTWPPSANTCSPRAATCRWPLTSSRASSTRIAITAFRWASRWCSAGRWCAAPTWPTR